MNFIEAIARRRVAADRQWRRVHKDCPCRGQSWLEANGEDVDGEKDIGCSYRCDESCAETGGGWCGTCAEDYCDLHGSRRQQRT